MTRQAALTLTLGMLAAARLAALAVYGPGDYPDSAEYRHYAELILSGGDWLHQVDLQARAGHVHVFRAIGYPAVLAGASLIAGTGFDWLVAILQCLLSLLAAGFVFRMAEVLTGRLWAGTATALAYGLSQLVWLDLALLADSLFASLYVIATCVVAIDLLTGRSATFGRALAIGLMLAGLALLRSNGAMVAATLLPLFLAWVSVGQHALARRALVTVVLLLPVFITVSAYRHWNEQRTGTAFVTTGAQIVALQATFEMVRQGARPFEADTALDRAVRAAANAYSLAEVGEVNQRLHAEQGWTALQLADAMTAKYFDTIGRFPGAFLRMVLRNLKVEVFLTLANPVFGLHELHQMTTEERLFIGWPEMIKGTKPTGPGDLLYAVAYTVFALISGALFLVFAVAAPLLAIRGWRVLGPSDRRSVVLAGLWLAYMGVTLMYAAIHLELRYIACVAALPVAGGIACAAEAHRLWRTHEQRRRPS